MSPYQVDEKTVQREKLVDDILSLILKTANGVNRPSTCQVYGTDQDGLRDIVITFDEIVNAYDVDVYNRVSNEWIDGDVLSTSREAANAAIGYGLRTDAYKIGINPDDLTGVMFDELTENGTVNVGGYRNVFHVKRFIQTGLETGEPYDVFTVLILPFTIQSRPEIYYNGDAVRDHILKCDTVCRGCKNR